MGWGWFSCDEDTGEVVAKTDVQNDGAVNRYEYTKSDDIKAGHGDTRYDSMDDFLNDKPDIDTSRDKNDPSSIDRPWFGNGYNFGLNYFKKYENSNYCLHSQNFSDIDDLEAIGGNKKLVLKIH